MTKRKFLNEFCYCKQEKKKKNQLHSVKISKRNKLSQKKKKIKTENSNLITNYNLYFTWLFPWLFDRATVHLIIVNC